MYVGGSVVDNTSVGDEPNDWSDPIVQTLGGGSAQVIVGADTTCYVEFPAYVYVYMEVSGTSPETEYPEPSVSFWADVSEDDCIRPGECTTLHWNVSGAVSTIHYQGGGVSNQGSHQECPMETTTYELRVKKKDGSTDYYYVTVCVEEATQPPPTNTPRPHTPVPTQVPVQISVPLPTSTFTPLPLPTSTPLPTPTPPPEPEPRFKLLVVTHSGALNYYTDRGDTWTHVRGWLDDRYGTRGYDVVDLAEISPNQVPDQWQFDSRIHEQWLQARYWAIFIIGGHDVVPFALGTNPVPQDEDFMWTDDLYADFDGDWVPDVPLARLPDVGDFSLLQAQLATSPGPTASGGFVMVNEGLTYADQFAAAAGTETVYSPPYDRSRVIGMNSAFSYFDLGAVLNEASPHFNRAWFDGLWLPWLTLVSL